MACSPPTAIPGPGYDAFVERTRCIRFSGSGTLGSIILTSSSTLLQANAVVGLVGGPIQINGSKITAQRIIVGSTSISR